MVNEQKKKTAQTSSVGADDQRSISQKNNITIPDFDAKNNPAEDDFEEFYRQIQRMQDPTYLHTVTLDELMERVFQGKAAVVENLLYTGAYILAGAPKIGKSFLVAQIAYHVSSGRPLWGYQVRQGTVLYLALEDDEGRLQRRMYRMFGVEGANSLYFATNAKLIGSGLDGQLENFVQEHRDTRLIVIDTLQKVRETVNDTYSYSSDYDVIGKLKQFADKHESSHRARRTEWQASLPYRDGGYWDRRLWQRKRILNFCSQTLPSLPAASWCCPGYCGSTPEAS